MRRIHVQLHLDQPCAASAVSVSEGGHTTLPYVRGRALLGAVGRRYLEAESAGIAWDLFRSGKVRFSDARLLDPESGAPCMPVPLSWHAAKGVEPSDLVANPGVLRDHTLVVGAERAGSVPLAKTGRQLTPSGRLRLVSTSGGLRTAVDHARQAAATGQLFGYEAIAAGTKLGFTVEIDLEGASAEEAERLVTAVLAEPLHLGRSRSAEYGTATATIVPPWAAPGQSETAADQVFVLCLSELVAYDDLGRPGALPIPQQLGLPASWTLDLDRSFVRRVRWSPFNGHWRRREVERLGITPGSVLAYRGPAEDLDLAQARAATARGVGAHRSEGLGRVVVQPAFVGVVESERIFHPRQPSAPPPEPPAWPDDSLGSWLRTKHDAETSRRAAQERADAFVTALPKRVKNGGRDWPSASQWRRLAGLGRVRLDGGPGAYASLRLALFGDGGLCTHGVSERLWAREVRRGKELRAALEELLPPELPNGDRVGPLVAALAGGEMAHELNRRRERSDT